MEACLAARHPYEQFSGGIPAGKAIVQFLELTNHFGRAKRIDGVVYLKQEDGVPALYWHEWVEAYVGEWTQLDPTFGQEVADATHFAVGEEGNAEITPLIGQIKVLKVQ